MRILARRGVNWRASAAGRVGGCADPAPPPSVTHSPPGGLARTAGLLTCASKKGSERKHNQSKSRHLNKCLCCANILVKVKWSQLLTAVIEHVHKILLEMGCTAAKLNVSGTKIWHLLRIKGFNMSGSGSCFDKNIYLFIYASRSGAFCFDIYIRR